MKTDGEKIVELEAEVRRQTEWRQRLEQQYAEQPNEWNLFDGFACTMGMDRESALACLNEVRIAFDAARRARDNMLKLGAPPALARLVVPIGCEGSEGWR